MPAIFAEPTFLGLRAEAWSAIGVWVTIALSLLVVLIAYRQVREAQELRHEQTRPFVIVDVEFRSLLVLLSVRNVGSTSARNVRVRFDEEVTSSLGDPDWQHSTLFADGMPMMAPGRQVRFLLDSYITRTDKSLPMVIRGTVFYDGPTDSRREPYTEAFIIDLTNYEGSQLSDKGLDELVDEVERVRKELSKWTDGIHGLRVNASDRDRVARQERRAVSRRRRMAAKRAGGWRGGARHWLDHWLGRAGLR